MLLISPKNEFPRHIGDLQLEHPNFKQGDKIPNGWKLVQETERPKPQTNQVVEQGFPVEVDGVMTQNWQIRDMTAEEIERRDAPKRAKEKLVALGLTDSEVEALVRGLR